MGLGFNFNFFHNTSQQIHQTPANGWAPPTMASAGNNPAQFQKAIQGYTQALEGHFKNNIGGMHEHISGLDRSSQKAVLENSEKMRDFLGISNPNAFRKIGQSEGETIHYSAAPAALANAATLMSKESRVDRTLAQLDAVLSQHPLHGPGKVRSEYKASSETAFVSLLDNLGNFTSARQKQHAVAIISQHAQHLDPTGRANVAAAAKRALMNPGVSSTLEGDLKRLTLPSVSQDAGRNKFFTKFGHPDGLNKPLPTTPQSARPAPASPHGMGGPVRGTVIHVNSMDEIPASALSPKQLLSQLKAKGMNDGQIEAVKREIFACSHLLKSGDTAAANAAMNEYNSKYAHLAGPMNAQSIVFHEAMSMEMQTDLNTRKPPRQLAGELARSGWQNHDLQRFKDAIDKCLHASQSGKPALIMAALKEYNQTWAPMVGPMGLPVAQGFGHLSAALGHEIAAGTPPSAGSTGSTGPAREEAQSGSANTGSAAGADSAKPVQAEDKPAAVPLAVPSYNKDKIGMANGAKPNDIIAQLQAGGFTQDQLKTLRQEIRAYFDTGSINTAEGRQFAGDSKMFDAKYANVFATAIEADEGKKAFGMLMQKLPR